MFVAAGVGVYSVAMFHLFTHAFFKAMLFLGAGSVIHGMHHEQDMRNYGALRKKMPLTFWAMMIGTLAITGVGVPLTTIGFAGFLSKDAVIEAAYAGTNGGYAFWMLVIAALFTSFYSWRLMFLTFYGEQRGDKHTHEHAHESPTVMLIPLGVLAIGAVLAGMVWYNVFFGKTEKVAQWFGVPYHAEEHHAEGHDDHGKDGHGKDGHAMAKDGHDDHAKDDHTKDDHAMAKDDHSKDGHSKDAKPHYVLAGKPGEGAIYAGVNNDVLNEAHYVPKWVKISPFIAMLTGFIVALWFYIWNPSMPARVAAANRPLYLFLLNKWYFDEIYDAIFVKPAQALGRFLWKRGDGTVIDGFLNGVAMGIVPFFTRLAGKAQSGYIFTYAFAMVVGIVVLITWMTLSGGAH
jgi:NADH-quinone oxidoreductase subunit L